jgi:hypothetical protein
MKKITSVMNTVTYEIIFIADVIEKISYVEISSAGYSDVNSITQLLMSAAVSLSLMII